jgi:hypothetical protein
MRPVALPQRPGFGGSGFLAIQAVSARGYVRSIAVRTRVSCYAASCFAADDRRGAGPRQPARLAVSGLMTPMPKAACRLSSPLGWRYSTHSGSIINP